MSSTFMAQLLLSIDRCC